MGVPNTNTFNLQNVVNEILPATNDLQACISSAISGKYDPNYYTAPATSLLEFRNYGAITSNTLSVTTTSVSFPPIPLALVSNQSTSVQTLTYTWKYVNQVSDFNATVRYQGIIRSIGYVTPTLTQSFSAGQTFQFFSPFTLSGGNAATVQFEFVLLTASVDTVPQSPNNKTQVYVSP